MPYKSVDIPDDKPPTEYHYTERRAEIFQMIIEAGHPDLISQKKLAEHYDMDPGTISRDIDRIEDEIHEHLGTDAVFISETIYRRAIREMADREDWKDAIDYLESYNDWLMDVGGVEKEPAKHEIDVDGDVDHGGGIEFNVDISHETPDVEDAIHDSSDGGSDGADAGERGADGE